MKKYLMTGIAALAMCAGFTSCSHDLSDPTQEDVNQYVSLKVTDNYNRAFIDKFGQPAANQDWGFGTASSARALTRANPGETYPATHSYTDANGNVIAGANMNHNQWGSTDLQSMPYGGWIVPDPLTEGQKERVKAYFQANPKLSYEDPHFRHFYVQQVYKGGTSAPQTGNQESTKAADGSSYNGSNMNLLTVGVAESHINDFNNGDCTTSNVLNHEGKTQSDQITLMVNVYDTSCFGYHNTGASVQKNDKMALVSAATIDAWAAQNGNPGAAVVDKWNRSFMGFDFELKDLESAKDGSYARFDSGQNNGLQYVWDGTEVLKRGTAPTTPPSNETDLTEEFLKYGYNISNKGNGEVEFAAWGGIQAYMGNVDWSTYDKLVIEFAEPCPFDATLTIAGQQQEIKTGDTKVEFILTGKNLNNVNEISIQSKAAGTLKISKVTLYGSAPQVSYYESDYLLVNDQQVPFLSTNKNMYGGTLQTISDDDMKIEKDGKWCFNMAKIAQLVNDGYLPVKDKNLREWVKWQGGDGYYSDWIVTLTEAKRISTTPEPEYETRILGEDLTPGDTDWDFNDVVFAVEFSGTTANCTLLAAGGTLPLRIYTVANETNPEQNYVEVHDLFGVETNVMVNTGGISTTVDRKPTFTVTGVNPSLTGKDIIIKVNKGTKTEPVWVELTANQGEPAAKLAVTKNFKVCTERQNINTIYTRFTDWVANPEIKWY